MGKDLILCKPIMMKRLPVWLCAVIAPLLSFSQTTYYSKSTGNLNTLATWGTSTNGTGTAPTSFTAANCTYIIVNNTAPTISANWTVSGANSKVQVGDGTQTINFTIPSPRSTTATYSVMVNSTLTAASGSTLSGSTVNVDGTLNNSTNNNPTFGTLGTNSTISYSRAGAQTVVNATYANLSISGSGAKTIGTTTNTTVNKVLTLNSGPTFDLANSSTYTCTLNGTVTGAGTISGANNGNLAIGGTGALGTLTFTSGSQTVNALIINRTSSGSITLGSSVTVRNNFTLTNGVLAINGNTLTFNGAVTFPASAANGTISGSSTSNLSISATSITNSFYMTTGAQTLNNFTINSSGLTFVLGTSMTVGGAYAQTRGTVNLNGQTLTLNGTVSFASSGANGTTTGSSTSNLLINASSISNRLYLTAGGQTLNNFTLNSSGATLTMGTGVTVSGAFTQTNGILAMNGQTITLSGTVTFPASSTNGTITGSNTSNLYITASTITNPVSFTSGGQALLNLTLNSPSQTLKLGSSLTLSGALVHTSGIININGNTLTLNGAITFPASVSSGSYTGSSTSSISVGGSGTISNSFYMTQGGTANYINNFTLNRTSRTITLGNAMNLVGALTPTLGTFASGGYLTLLATSSTAVGRIATIGGSVTGNVTVQMYAKGGTTGWTLLGSPGLTGRTFSDWDDNTTITCPSCPDGYWYSFTSIYSYSETVGGTYSNSARYFGISNVTDAMTAGKGYWVYLGTATNTTADIILDVTGPVNQGNFAFNLTRTNTGGGTNATDHGYNLLCNPFPSPIQWSLLRNGNINVSNAIYVYNPDLSGYASYVGGVSSPAVGSGGIGNYIPAGQGFYVKANAASVTLTGQESNKAASTQQLLRGTGQQQTQSSSATPMVMRLNANGHNMHTETAIYFDLNATTAFDNEYDALYMAPDAGHLGIGTRLNGSDLGINGMPALTQNYSIPVFVTTDTTDTYSISGADLQNMPGGACLMLHDNYTGLDKDLRTGVYTCTISDTEKVAARFVLNITINTSLVVNGTSLDPTCSAALNGMLTAMAQGSGPWNYFWKDANNNIVKTSLNKTTSDTLFNVGSGNYSVDVNTVGTCDNGTASFVLNNSNTASASFTPSATSTIFVADSVNVTFTNTSLNATSYWWDFGDGMGTADTSVNHPFTAPGDYNVTLMAISACGDTTSYSEVIHIADGSGVGVAAVAEPSKNMFISRDAGGYFAQFNYSNAVGAHIEVTNMLGEKVISDLDRQSVLKDKVYIPLGDDNSNRILIISVITTAGEKTFSKIVY